jgi:hypothetical protein
MRIIQHFLDFGTYFLLVLAAIGKPSLVIVKKRDVARFPDFPAKDEACNVPSDLNNGLERPAHATTSACNRIESVGFVVLVVRMGGHWRFPYRVSDIDRVYVHADTHEFVVC